MYVENPLRGANGRGSRSTCSDPVRAVWDHINFGCRGGFRFGRLVAI